MDPDIAALFAAIRDGDAGTVGALVRERRELANALGPSGQTPLHLAAECNEPRIGGILLAAGANVEARMGESGHTPLSWAVTCNALEFAFAMWRNGATLDLFCAAGLGVLDAVQACFETSGALKAGASRTGSSRYVNGVRLPCPPATAVEQVSDALYIACRNGHPCIIRFLLSGTLPSGAAPTRPDLAFRAYDAATPLHWAYFGGSREAIDLLLAAGADPVALDNTLHVTPRAFGICTPAGWGFGKMVRARLDADPALAFIAERTSPLHEAARNGHVPIIEMLRGAGANPATLNADGKTPLDLALAGGHEKAAAALRD